jgi:hypothetical protein
MRFTNMDVRFTNYFLNFAETGQGNSFNFRHTNICSLLSMPKQSFM